MAAYLIIPSRSDELQFMQAEVLLETFQVVLHR